MTESMFVSVEDIQILTGTSQRSKQIDWLARHGYAFELNRKGQPVLLKAELEAHLISNPKRSHDSYHLKLETI